MAQDNVQYDVNGYDIVTKALMDLLAQFPLLDSDEEINFSVIDSDEGIAFFPVSGAIVVNATPLDVTGHMEQLCAYPFVVIYKASGLTESRKANVKEWLDTLGKWLEKQIIDVNGIETQLKNYPPLNDNREFVSIQRTCPSYLMETSDDKVDSWAVNITAQYKNEFDRI